MALDERWLELKSELEKPVATLKEKYKLLPVYLKVRGLFKHHIDSYNYFIQEDLKQIVEANEYVRSESDPNFYLRYLDIRVGKPSVQDGLVVNEVTPMECRLRDMTYSAPIIVDI